MLNHSLHRNQAGSLGATYTPHGLRLDRLTTTQRRILNLLNINPPWPEQ